MTLELIDALFFTVFEGCLFFAGIATTYFISKRTNKNFSTPELILSWILFSILFSVLITSIFSFTKFNGSLQYVISSILLVGFIHIILKGNFVQYYEYIRLTFFQVISESFNWKILLIILFLIPVVIMMMLPISDSDSIQFIEYMLRWVNNETIPYDNWVHYTSVWELTYLPSLIITQSENYVWYNSLKPLIIMGLGTYLILENLKLPRKISWLAIFSSILYYPMWAGWEHIGTFKDDYIMSAGLILLVLATLKLSKGNFNLLYKIFVIVGFGFATIKFAGLFIGIFALILFLIFNRKRISRSKKKVIVVV